MLLNEYGAYFFALGLALGPSLVQSSPRNVYSRAATDTQPLFDYEKKQISMDTANSWSADDAALFGFDDISTNAHSVTNSSKGLRNGCKIFPGDPEWPSDDTWAKLNQTLEGVLIKTVPRASVCYAGANYDATSCASMSKNWTNSYDFREDPVEMLSPDTQGLTCQPPTLYNSTSCTLGGYPVYVVKALNAAQVQLAVNFARNNNIRLVIRNTGHDFLGKSGGAGSLSIWTHHMKDTRFIPQYSGPSKNGIAPWTGAAVKVGSGIQAYELYNFAHDNNVMAVGGEAQTVGVMGGYIQGGGHSPLSSMYGMAADQVLEMEIVTADGRFVTASPSSNQDLFWAVRGGGGSTFGVVTSVTVKVHPSIPATSVSLVFAAPLKPKDTFWAGVRAYFDNFPAWVDAGIYSYFYIMPISRGGPRVDGSAGKSGPMMIDAFMLRSFMAPNKTAAETEALLEPFTKKLESLGIVHTKNVKYYNTYFEAWKDSFPLEPSNLYGEAPGSRLFPRKNWEDHDLYEKTFAAIRKSYTPDRNILFLMLSPTLARGGNPDNAVNPAWRDTILHATQTIVWPANASVEDKKAVRKRFTEELQPWRDLTPGSGAYLSEADRNEPDWQEAFYGRNYERLLGIKRKLDPREVFFAATGVGSDGWEVRSESGLPDENGRLCRVGS
ncbi:hypothetical protein K402DRAFT_396457 [Aulographum hederae CBS 113979]|uniref:FAD-binding PCMH-type domain-containing protein n=1 Tax=Aulographum hederae CBS 113979 TaxID=1176131 RepID=A0A6G1GSE7_9PEZI|nr:hypothetical protein K402DRAFT_396457 [Aulographum hederae CBS 113979]